MKLDGHRLLDALCGEYLLGTLRGGARRRFERALQGEPRVALRMAHWEGLFAPTFSTRIERRPPAGLWRRLDRGLGLARYRTPWHRRASFWKGWAAAASFALVLTVAVQQLNRPPPAPQVVEIAQLTGEQQPAHVTAHLSRDGRTLVLHASRPVLAGPKQSYELWLIPVEGGPALSVAVLGSLDASFSVPPAQVGRLVPGATLAVTPEPAGGAPTGKATGPIILAGKITS